MYYQANLFDEREMYLLLQYVQLLIAFSLYEKTLTRCIKLKYNRSSVFRSIFYHRDISNLIIHLIRYELLIKTCLTRNKDGNFVNESDSKYMTFS